ncbi:MAG: transporter substrate-binding domain-containing protein [Paludibacteraceae bacterium]|nr:transporter substrate-binding domain-containing protein [Paludibacteraceae bacterium]
MNKQRIFLLSFSVIVLAFVAISAIVKTKYAYHNRDFKEIFNSGELKVIVEDNKMSYFTVQCDSMVECDSLEGLQVKMVEEFAKKYGLNVTFIEQRNLQDAITMLGNDEVDLLVWHIPVYNDMKERIAYTIPVFTSRQMLIQRKRNKKDTTQFITNQLDLAEKEVYIVPGSIFKQRLEHLQKEMGDTIYLREIPGSNDDLLFRLVSDHSIDYSVCDEFVARVLQKEYPNVDRSTAVSFTQNYSWGVSPSDPALLDSLNTWLAVYLESKEYNKIYRKYTGVK